MSIEFPQDAKVRFTQERLSILAPRDRQGLAGRIGVVQADHAYVRKPTVYFPVDGSKPELRLFRVDPRHIERVDSPASLNDSVNHAAPAPDGGGNLSQEDLDNFFE